MIPSIHSAKEKTPTDGEDSRATSAADKVAKVARRRLVKSILNTDWSQGVSSTQDLEHKWLDERKED